MGERDGGGTGKLAGGARGRGGAGGTKSDVNCKRGPQVSIHHPPTVASPSAAVQQQQHHHQHQQRQTAGSRQVRPGK